MSLYWKCAYGDLHLMQRIPTEDRNDMVAVRYAGSCWSKSDDRYIKGSATRFWINPDELVEAPNKEIA